MKSRYEELRQRAMQVETATGPSRWGPALLIRYGMAGWMSAHNEHDSDEQRPARQTPVVPSPRQTEIVALLAELVLNQYRESANA